MELIEKRRTKKVSKRDIRSEKVVIHIGSGGHSSFFFFFIYAPLLLLGKLNTGKHSEFLLDYSGVFTF